MDIEAVLRDGGHRVTRPRRLVWDVLQAADTHLSAQEIVDRVNEADPSINRSSIYRVLGLLAELGLVRESHLAGVDRAASTWEVTHSDGVIHLVCSVCGLVEHHDTGLIEQLRQALSDSPSFQPDSIDVRVSGTCAGCGRSAGIGPRPVSAAE